MSQLGLNLGLRHKIISPSSNLKSVGLNEKLNFIGKFHSGKFDRSTKNVNFTDKLGPHQPSLFQVGNENKLMNMFYLLFFYQVEVLISRCRFVWVLCTDLHKLRESTIGEESNLQWKMLTSQPTDI